MNSPVNGRLFFFSIINPSHSRFHTQNPRVFNVLRNPIHRIVDQYYDEYRPVALQSTMFETDDDGSSVSRPLILTLEEYVGMDGYIVDNWLTRTITGRLQPIEQQVDDERTVLAMPKLDPKDLDLAKRILNEKFRVGLYWEVPSTTPQQEQQEQQHNKNSLSEFVETLELQFRWDVDENCRNQVLSEDIRAHQIRHQQEKRYPLDDSEIGRLIASRNEYDVKLWELFSV